MFGKKKIPMEGVMYKTSRISYIQNYILIFLVFVILLLVFPLLDILGNPIHLVIFFGLLMCMSALSEEPEWERIFRKYVITNNEIIKLDGWIRKKTFTIPYQSVADIRVSKGFVGRLLNFGNIEIVGFKEGIIMKGIRNPEETQNIIKNKINLMRAAFIKKKGSKQKEYESETE